MGLGAPKGLSPFGINKKRVLVSFQKYVFCLFYCSNTFSGIITTYQCSDSPPNPNPNPKLASLSVPVPATLICSVRPEYRYPTLQQVYYTVPGRSIYPTELVGHDLNTLQNNPVCCCTNSIPVRDTSVSSVPTLLHVRYEFILVPDTSSSSARLQKQTTPGISPWVSLNDRRTSST